MASCNSCERNPVVSFNGRGLCADHADQWVTVETNHASLTSGPMPDELKRLGSRQQGAATHKPRHY